MWKQAAQLRFHLFEREQKNVRRFLKNVGDFSKNVGVFFQNVGSFWGHLRHFLLIFSMCGNVCGSVVAQEMERRDWLKA